MSKFKKRGAVKKGALSFTSEEEEEENAFSSGVTSVTKKIKQAPGSLNELLVAEKDGNNEDGKDQVVVSNREAAEAIRKSKQDLRNFYQGDDKSYERASILTTEVMEESIDMDVDVDVDRGEEEEKLETGLGEKMMKTAEKSAAENTGNYGNGNSRSGSRYKPRKVRLQSFQETVDGIERARDALVQSKTNLENKLMRQESERDRLLEANPDLAIAINNEEGGHSMPKQSKSDQKLQEIRDFRTFCGELVGMLREKEGAIGETRALVLAQYSKNSFNRGEIAQFASIVFQDAKEEFCSCESILKRFADFREASTKAVEAVTREQAIAQRFDRTSSWTVAHARGNGGIYASAYISLSLPELLHPLITVDLLQEPLLGTPPTASASATTSDTEGAPSASPPAILELQARTWFAGLCQYALGERAADADADGDGTLVVRVLLRTVVPMVKDTLRVVAEMEENERGAFSSRALPHFKCLVKEIRTQVAAARPSPCEATIKLSSELDALLADETKKVFTNESDLK